MADQSESTVLYRKYRPKAFAAGKTVYSQVTSLYPVLQNLAASNTSFLFVLEIQGLNEFFGEYAQIESP